MRKTFNNIFVALALTGASLTGVMIMGTGTAYADNVGISINLGDVAIGYYDGYWDHDHRWHRWQSSRYRHSYRQMHGAEYHNARHTRFENDGWYEHDDHYDHHHHHHHHDDNHDDNHDHDHENDHHDHHDHEYDHH